VLLFAVLHEAEVRQGDVDLALVVCGRLGQVMAEASLEVTVAMRYADGGEAGHVATNVGFGVGRGSVRFHRLYQGKRCCSRLRSALRPSPLVVWPEGSRSCLVACLFRATTVGTLRSACVWWQVARFVGRVLLMVDLCGCYQAGS